MSSSTRPKHIVAKDAHTGGNGGTRLRRLAMRAPHPLVTMLAIGALLAVGCDSNEVEAVGITFSVPGHKYDSHLQPRRFGYRSENPAVATVDADGIVVANRTGTATIFASVEGVTSPPLTLHVSPVASELLATPSELTINVGDTAKIMVTALDAAGSNVQGPLFAVTTDTTWWTTVSPLEWGRMQTPGIVRFVAKSAGTGRVRAYLMHERLTRQVDAKVQLTVTLR